MEGLTRLVAESLARHGLEPSVDHRRLQWSRWSRLESSFDLVLLPSKPGLFAVGEEILAPGKSPVGGKRMLAILEVNHAGDLGIAMGRLFAATNPVKDRIATGRVFARYTVIEDDAQREAAHASLQRWLSQSTEAATGIASDPVVQSAGERGGAEDSGRSDSRTNALHSEVKEPTPIPAGF